MTKIRSGYPSTGYLDNRNINVPGDTMIGTFKVEVPTATSEALILKTTDDDTTKNLFEIKDSSGNVLNNMTSAGILERETRYTFMMGG